MTPTPDALAAWLDALERWLPEHEKDLARQSAAALRALTAERERLRERLEVVEREANWDREVAHPDQVARLRRKVARYIGRAREWMRGCDIWSDRVVAVMRERDAAVALGRELAVALDEASGFLLAHDYNSHVDALAKARAAGWLEG